MNNTQQSTLATHFHRPVVHRPGSFVHPLFNDLQQREEMALRRRAEEHLAKEMQELLAEEPNDAQFWLGAQCDLYEAVIVAWDTRLVRDPETGAPMQQKRMMEEVCRRLMVSVPANPRTAARRARQRKGVKAESYMGRYQYWLATGEERPFYHLVKESKTQNNLF